MNKGSPITFYQKPTCTTCRQVHAILVEKGVDFQAVNYYFDPIPRDKLVELLHKLNMSPRELLRTKEPLYAELGLDKTNFSDDHLIDLMAKHPDLMQRPIVERGAKAIVARPAERLREIL